MQFLSLSKGKNFPVAKSCFRAKIAKSQSKRLKILAALRLCVKKLYQCYLSLNCANGLLTCSLFLKGLFAAQILL